ncbi:Nudix family hydrolase [Gilvimarinus sp. F26214L]|uniref:Nudix family hydrolase n=1 Tax=Gilvimarinus sp. DZF01 TaxID=3461371 RepID=UPI004046376B
MTDYLHVAVGVVRDEDGRVLLAKRRDDVHQGGLWEFPGGKVEPGESIETALARELHEELLIGIESSEPLIQIRHHYPDKSVLLDVRQVTRFSGAPRGNEGQPLAWVDVGELGPHGDYPLPAANRTIVKALNLPDAMLISGALGDRDEFLMRLEQALEKGIRLVLLRPAEGMNRLAPEERAKLVEGALQMCTAYGARVILHQAIGDEQEAQGLHLTAQGLMACDGRPTAPGQLCGASCHTEEELLRAEQLDLDYALLSPVAQTATHPNQPPLGWERFAALVEAVNIPIYALGGLGMDNLSRAKEAGAQGVAAIRAFWG